MEILYHTVVTRQNLDPHDAFPGSFGATSSVVRVDVSVPSFVPCNPSHRYYPAVRT